MLLVLTIVAFAVFVAILLYKGLVFSPLPSGVITPGAALPLLGHWISLARQASDNPLRFFWTQTRDSGFKPVGAWLPGAITYIRTFDCRDVEALMQTHFENFARPPASIRGWRSDAFFGQGIFMSNGAHWHNQRNATRKFFTVAHLRQYFDTFCAKAEVVVGQLEDVVQDQTISVQTLFLNYTLDVFGQLGFGVDFNSLEAPSQFGQAFDNMQLRVESTARNLRKRTADDPEFKSWWRYVDETILDMITQRHQTGSFQENNDILSRFMSQKENYSDSLLKDMTQNFLIAGRDTTALTAMWLMYCLSENPDVEKRLIAEIDSLSEITYDTVNRLPYFDNVLAEVLRLYPIVPTDGRVATKDMVLPSGISIKKGQLLGISSYIMHRREDYFKDALRFNPDRWNGLKLKNSYCYIPFHGGEQRCLGQNLALLEIKALVSHILKRVQLRVPDGQLIRPQKAIVLKCYEGMPMHVYKRGGPAPPRCRSAPIDY